MRARVTCGEFSTPVIRNKTQVCSTIQPTRLFAAAAAPFEREALSRQRCKMAVVRTSWRPFSIGREFRPVQSRQIDENGTIRRIGRGLNPPPLSPPPSQEKVIPFPFNPYSYLFPPHLHSPSSFLDVTQIDEGGSAILGNCRPILITRGDLYLVHSLLMGPQGV